MVAVTGRGIWRLEAMDLDCLGVDLKTLVLVDEKILHSIALVALQLDHVAGLLIVDDGAVASKLFLDDLEDFLEVELGWDGLDRGQCLATITLLDADVDVWRLGQIRLRQRERGGLRTGLRGLLSCLSSVLILRIRKGICFVVRKTVIRKRALIADGQQGRRQSMCRQNRTITLLYYSRDEG